MIINNFNDFNNFNIIKIIENNNIFPSIRHLSSYESAISILENKNFMSRQELLNNNINVNKKNKKLEFDNKWWIERKNIELEKFKTENLIFCTPDWYNTYDHETGHGPVMFYFKPTIFEDYKVTFTLLDNVSSEIKKVYEKNELSDIYNSILNEGKKSNLLEAKTILKNLDITNIGSIYNTSRGKIFIEEGKFYYKYSEVQIHSNKIPIEYISEIKLTNNYLDYSEEDNNIKEKFISFCKKLKIKIII